MPIKPAKSCLISRKHNRQLVANRSLNLLIPLKSTLITNWLRRRLQKSKDKLIKKRIKRLVLTRLVKLSHKHHQIPTKSPRTQLNHSSKLRKTKICQNPPANKIWIRLKWELLERTLPRRKRWQERTQKITALHSVEGQQIKPKMPMNLLWKWRRIKQSKKSIRCHRIHSTNNSIR
jgi:hypothetical protein